MDLVNVHLWEMADIAELMHQALSAPKDLRRLLKLEATTRDLCRQFPLFADEWQV